jgi:hypothetical protein
MIACERIKEIKQLYEQQVIPFFSILSNFEYIIRIKMFRLYGVAILMRMKHH